MTEQMDLAEATANVHAVVPILGAMGLEIVEASPGRAAARIPSGPNVNHFGVAYAGSLFSVAEMLGGIIGRSEEHTSELQSQFHLVCRLLLEKKKQQT